jgi:NADH:ubiquinone oxidoreductase subunit K
VLLFVGLPHRLCQWTANLQSNSAICVLMSAMLALRSVSITMLTIASNAHKYVAAVLKNVEEWQDNNR